MSDTIVDCINLKKSYRDGNKTIDVLQDIDFSIKKGERLAIVGPSGSGKSTFLHLLGGLDKPTEGQVLIEGQDWQVLKEKARCKLRNKALGFIYQFHHLLPEFTALENAAMPLLLRGMSTDEAAKQSQTVLQQVGLEHRIDHRPSELSGGERQRVAIARALIHQPQCVFADEPTGNLDQTTATKVFDLMLELNKTIQTALVIVTHDTKLAERMDRVFYLDKGQLREEL
jgi:lipoprotein-releasing system ATP-binding protein